MSFQLVDKQLTVGKATQVNFPFSGRKGEQMRSKFSETMDGYDEGDEEFFHFEVKGNNNSRPNDDEVGDSFSSFQIKIIMDSLTRVGGEVNKLRAEVDGLLEEKSSLIASFNKLKEVILAKGNLNLDDFELACEVMENSTESARELDIKKMLN